MKVKQTTTADGKLELKAVAPAAKVREALYFTEAQLAMQNGIPLDKRDASGSFRQAIIDQVGEAYYNSFIVFQTLNFLAPFAVSEAKVAIIGPPKVAGGGTSIDPNKDLEFVVHATPKPVHEMSDFSPVKIKLPKVNVEEYEIDNQLLMMAESRATYEPDNEHPVLDGNDVVFAIATTDEHGKAVGPLTAEKRNYRLGENFLPKGFDENILGMKVGETKTFKVSSPLFVMPEPPKAPEAEGDAESAAEADAAEAPETPEAPKEGTFEFTVTITEIQKKIVPAVTDKWVAANTPPLKTVPELREEIRRQGFVAKEKELENMKSYMAAAEFAKRLQVKIPDELYELTRDDILQNMQQQLQSQGRTLQQYIEEQGGGEQQFSMMLMMQTREVLVQGFSLDALARHLKLKVEEADIAETFAMMAPGHEHEARQEFEITGRMYLIEEGALRNKANKWLVEHAEIEYADNPGAGNAGAGSSGDGSSSGNNSGADKQGADNQGGM